jgi:acyl-[acyl-carrier-protein]-phospholipid O-acyltransferase/long-chain-fatty-acid--[acyl-carrier-protein] ligase
MRKADGNDFQLLERVITGGEKLRTDLAEAFEEKFGIPPLQGYGCTELSPVAMLSLQNGHRTDSVGQPLPGVAVRMVDPQTGAPVPANQEGLMLVKGPNVMQGYLGQPRKTFEVITDGWYNTGDIARMDGDGFVYITDRLSRFSKIGGEMVPHAVVEEKLQQASGTREPCVAVLGIQDRQKGEQLAVCFTEQAGNPNQLLARLRKMNLPNLWIPRASHFVPIQCIPVLATGKLDLQTLKAWTDQIIQRPEAAA